jgi:hypothetical protein
LDSLQLISLLFVGRSELTLHDSAVATAKSMANKANNTNRFIVNVNEKKWKIKSNKKKKVVSQLEDEKRWGFCKGVLINDALRSGGLCRHSFYVLHTSFE